MNRIAGRLVVLISVTCALLGAEDVPEAPLAADALPTPSPELADAVREVLDQGFVIGQKSLQSVQKKLTAARRLAADDSRLDYAYGLVLLKQSQHKQAVAQFDTLVENEKAPYWPAWQALIWAQLIDRQFEKGLTRLDQFAALLRATEPAEDGRARETVKWMGQTFEALSRTMPSSKKNAELIETYASRIREKLGEELFAEFEVGREMTGERYSALTEQAGIDNDASDKRDDRRRKDEADKLAGDLDDLSKRKENAAKNVEDTKKSFEETLAKVDKELEKLEQEYQRLTERTKTLERTYLEAGRDVTALELGMNTTAGRSGASAVQSYQGQQRLAQRQGQMLTSQLEYNATIVRMTQIAQQGQRKMQERARIEQKYAKATGELAKKNADIDKWTTRVADRKKKLDAPPAKAKAAKAPLERKPTFKSLLPLDLEVEKSRLLAEMGVIESGPADENQPSKDK